jgi:hypothetical protein
MNTKIIKICGESEIIPDFEEISNDPNFIFPPDSSFGTKVLYDVDENIVNVNSWLECANYVNGGWFSEISNLINYEKRLFIVLLGFTSISLLKQMSKKYGRGSYFKK